MIVRGCRIPLDNILGTPGEGVDRGLQGRHGRRDAAAGRRGALGIGRAALDFAREALERRRHHPYGAAARP